MKIRALSQVSQSDSDKILLKGSSDVSENVFNPNRVPVKHTNTKRPDEIKLKRIETAN